MSSTSEVRKSESVDMRSAKMSIVQHFSGSPGLPDQPIFATRAHTRGCGHRETRSERPDSRGPVSTGARPTRLNHAQNANRRHQYCSHPVRRGKPTRISSRSGKSLKVTKLPTPKGRCQPTHSCAQRTEMPSHWIRGRQVSTYRRDRMIRAARNSADT